jgi:hypothetical protein
MQRLTISNPKAVRLATALALTLICRSTIGEAGAADPARQWFAQGDQAVSSVIYGTPESDDVLLSLTCDHATKALTVWYTTEPAYSKDPKTLPIDIHSEGGSISLIGNGSRSELDDAYSLDVTTELTPQFEKLLSEATTLTILVEDGTVELPVDETARKGIEMIKTGCRK